MQLNNSKFLWPVERLEPVFSNRCAVPQMGLTFTAIHRLALHPVSVHRNRKDCV